MKIPVKNNTAMTMYVHGVMILAGETRHIDEEFVPAHLKPAKAAPAAPAADPEADAKAAAEEKAKALAAQSALPAPELIASLPEASNEDLVKLEELEKAREKGPRKTVLEAISEETLKRAAAAEEKRKAEADGAGGAKQE